MGKKALLAGLAASETDEVVTKRLLDRYEEGIVYSRQAGNLYTGSLYLGLISLLENSQVLQAGDKIGLFSYGSGAVAEFFTGTLVAGFEEHLRPAEHQKLLAERTRLTIAEYEELFTKELTNENLQQDPDTTPYRITSLEAGVRHYQE